MSERLQVVATTVVVFLLGLGVGIWTQRMRAMPPPPITPMGEFGPLIHGGFGPPPPPAWMLGFTHGPPISPDEMRSRIEALEPQIAGFRHSVEAIEKGFRQQLDALMTPDQRHKLTDLEASIPPAPANFSLSVEGGPFGSMPPPPLPLPGCAGEAGNLFVPMVIYRPALDRLTEVLHLNPQQHNRGKALMIERRNRLLALVDETPPPSFKLGRIFEESAPVISPAP